MGPKLWYKTMVSNINGKYTGKSKLTMTAQGSNNNSNTGIVGLNPEN